MASNRHKKGCPVRLEFEKYVPDDCDRSLSPVIFVHGLASMLITWANVRGRIADATKREVYALNLRNHGKSEYSKDFNIDLLMADLENFMFVQGIEKAIFVGHSLGGKTASYLAMCKPFLVEKLFCEETTLSDFPIDKWENFRNVYKAFQRYLSLLPSDISKEEALSFVTKIAATSLSQDGGFSKHILTSIRLLLHKDRTGKFQMNLHTDVLDILEEISLLNIKLNDSLLYRGKVYFIYSEKSFMNVGKDKEMILKHMPNAVFEAVENGYHIIHAEYPDLYIHRVVDFVNN